MTLLDGQPLSPEEVAAHALCVCRHAYKSHGDGHCRLCARCKKFVEDMRPYSERKTEE